MRSNDSIQYYDHHAFQIGKTQAFEPGTVLQPFLALLPPESRVVDLGCGVGNDLLLLSQAGHQVSGLDASKGMVSEAKKRGIEVEIKNVLFWSPKANEWNGVWVNRSFQHLAPEEVQRVVASAFRGLSVGGVLGIIVPEGEGVFEDREGDLFGPSRWIHLYNENQICSLVEQTGFKVIQLGRRQSTRGLDLLVLAKRI